MSEEVKAEEVKEKKTIKAKDASLVGQIIASFWIAGLCLAIFITNIVRGNPVKITDVILSGFAIAGCYVPVYFNLIMEKIKDIRFGGNE